MPFPPMKPSAEAHRLMTEVKFSHDFERLLTKLVEERNAANDRVERMLAALLTEETVDIAGRAACFMSAGTSCKCATPAECWNFDDLTKAEWRAGLAALHDLLASIATGTQERGR